MSVNGFGHQLVRPTDTLRGVVTRQLQTIYEPLSCAVCGRSLLRGEHPTTFLDGATRREVCELCTARAAHEGWIREGSELSSAAGRGRGADRARSLVGRLRARREDTPSVFAVAAPAVHHVHAVPSAEHAQLARAVELFNRSDSTRTLAGVTRSLGAPAVNVRNGDRDVLVVIVILWELCWYRYEVDLESDSVRLQSQGYEPTDVEAEFTESNASADVQGMLALASR